MDATFVYIIRFLTPPTRTRWHKCQKKISISMQFYPDNLINNAWQTPKILNILFYIQDSDKYSQKCCILPDKDLYKCNCWQLGPHSLRVFGPVFSKLMYRFRQSVLNIRWLPTFISPFLFTFLHWCETLMSFTLVFRQTDAFSQRQNSAPFSL